MNKLIVSLATPYAMGAIHIIRVSGYNVFNKLNKICKKKITKKGFSIERNKIIDKKNKNLIDDVLLMKYVAPNSYTGEDLIEINCHGNVDVAQEIIDLIIQECGANLSEPGEFTKRAFLNNKINLNQAAAVDLFVKSKNKYSRNKIINSMLSSSFDSLEKIRNKIFKLIGSFEIGIDYPEYEEGLIDFINVKKELKKIIADLIKILKNSQEIMNINDGIKIALIGKPNVGKSSLLNAILKEDKAIVSNTPGTTRDIVEASVQIENFKITFLDTAGIHNHQSQLEKKGIKKTYETITKSDLVIFVCEANKKLTIEEKEIIKYLENKKKNFIVCFNKKDLAKSKTNFDKDSILISAKNKDINSLLKYLKNYLEKNLFSKLNQDILASKWQINYLNKVIKNLEQLLKEIDINPYIDILVDPLKDANETILKILGKIQDYDLMDEIFKNFCLGK
ncbi:tRNA uridine-5-carboxymethylaminomethyl(34) synthesis GTPase MnmE [Mycoplasmoides pirum]|uniref:tRNA uridine-5-carboxymethylaminomethyl(34) synthesis GTPase MnmE n=1 Tax=Mycoplasmoides pirum TaxID=2122 RepID=UPI000698AE7E|nr:tRNA uridine-5-carboxymethylaminomethyl(34) synthesis GTPase MnmE [Mycoplasmoides pirum]